MRTTENKTIVDLVNRLAGVIEARKTLDSEEKQIKDTLKDIMAGFESNVLGAGNWVVILSHRTRTDLDKAKLKVTLGADYELYEKKSEYQTLEIKKA